jgi:Ca2+ transporting ATPase
MEEDALITRKVDFEIGIEDCHALVDGWMMRERGDEELELFRKKGGEKWLLEKLKTHPDHGIDPASIEDREDHFGSNRKEISEPKTFWFFVRESLDDFLLRVLICAGVFSIVVDELMAEPDERASAWIEGAAILVAVLLIVLVTSINNLKKDQQFRKLNQEAEAGKVVTIIRHGKKLADVSMEEVEVGDLVIIKSGMENPGDGIVIDGFSIQVDESSMTGESKPMAKEHLDACLVKREALLKKGTPKFGLHELPSPVVLAGTKFLNGSGKMIIIAVGKHSTIGKINEIIQSSEGEMTPLQLKLEKLARDIGNLGFSASVLLITCLLLRWVIENSLNGNAGWHKARFIDHVGFILNVILMGVAVLVMAIPEGLPLAVTLSLAYSVDRMMKENNLVRKLEACETMGGANIICSDKTGTLTKNEMYLTHFWSGEESSVYNPTLGTASNFDKFTTQKTRDIFINTIVINSLEDPNVKKGNPTEMALLRYLHMTGIDVLKVRDSITKLFQAPFSSDRKRMSTIVKLGDGKTYAFIKGASEYILEISDKVLNLKTGEITSKDELVTHNIEGAIQHFAEKALRTIGLAYKEVDLSTLNKEPDARGIYDYEKNGFTLVGVCGIKDVIRPEVPSSIAKCHEAGIDVKMVTGDNKITAEAIAKEIGIITDKNKADKLVMEGPEFLRIVGGIICANCRDLRRCDCAKNQSDAEKPGNEGKKIRQDTVKNQEAFRELAHRLAVLARSRPEDKYCLVTGLKEMGNVVAVTGDGTNDAPALSKADVGFAMNIAGTEVAKQAADILLMDDNFASIVVAVKWGRNIYDSIRKFIMFQVTVNIVAVLMTFVSSVGLEESVFSTVQILWINLIMDTFAALALATEPPTDELLKRKPQSKDDYIISPIMKKHIIGQSIYQIIIMTIFIFEGPNFLPDTLWRRQLQPGKETIISGFTAFGYNKREHGGQFSVHAAYNFNVFVMMQLGNFFNCRILDNRLNIFWNITKSNLLIGIMCLIFVLQVFFLTLCGPAIKVVQWGLDPIGWLICIVFGMGGWIVNAIFKFIPLERHLGGAGNETISKEDLNRHSSLSLRQVHDERFYKRRESLAAVNNFVDTAADSRRASVLKRDSIRRQSVVRVDN